MEVSITFSILTPCYYLKVSFPPQPSFLLLWLLCSLYFFQDVKNTLSFFSDFFVIFSFHHMTILPLLAVLCVSHGLQLPSVFCDSWLCGHHCPGEFLFFASWDSQGALSWLPIMACVWVWTPCSMLHLSQDRLYPLVSLGPATGRRYCSSLQTREGFKPDPWVDRQQCRL